MELLLTRNWAKPTHTIGKLFVDGEYFCNSLEDPVADFNKNGRFDGNEKKIPGHTAIPYGSYNVVFTYSPRFKRHLPLLENVDKFSGVRIHPGNTVDDTEGCILLGRNSAPGRISESRYFCDKLNDLIEAAISRGEKVTLNIQ